MKETDNTLNISSINPARKADEPKVEAELPQITAAPADIAAEAETKPLEVSEPIEPATTPEAALPKELELPPAEVQKENTIQPEPADASAARDKISQLSDPYEAKLAHPIVSNSTLALLPAGTTTASTGVNLPRTPYQINIPTKWMKPVLGALGIFLLVLTLFETPVIFHQIQFLLNKPGSSTQANVASTVIGPDSVIDIPKINVHAPVVYEPSAAEANIQHSLENGVVHYASTAVPGQAGNDVIVGHSSNDWWEPGNYKFVFVLLDKLIPGDTFSINYQSQRYVYRVTNTQVVAPTDVGVLSPTATPTVTLITCTPPGTSWKRLVITAEQTGGPHNSEIAAQSTSPAGQPLPSDSSGTGSILQKIWHDITSLFGGNKNDQQTPANNQTNSLPQNL